jgi:ClpA/ClpB-like protein
MSRKLGTTAQQALGREPGKALTAIRRLRQELDDLEEAQVANALSRSWSWARIGRALGVTRQAVHRKYSTCAPAPLAWSGPVLASNLKVAIVVARTEAAARGDALVGTEHLLLGLLQQGDGSAAAALRAAGASLRTFRAAVDVLAPSDLCRITPSQITMTSRASSTVERAALIALREESERVTEEHLLRALLHATGSGALAVLAATGVSADRVEEALNGAGRQTVNSV